VSERVPRSPPDEAALVHELQVHQVELEMQNEELIRSRGEAEAAREQYQELYDFAPVGYFTISPDSSIRQANLTGARVLGVDRATLIGRRLASFVADADRPAFIAAIARASARGPDQSCEVMLGAATSAPAAPRYLQMTISAPAVGRELRVAAVDATERKRSEDQIRTSQKLEAIGQLAGGIAHDFNNLLTVILNHSDVALSSVDRHAPLHENLVELRAAAERAAGLTRQLLAFSSRQAIVPLVVDVNPLVVGIAAMLGRILGENIRLVLSLASDIGRIEIDPSQLDQILLNLAVNARDAMPEGGTLTLSTANVNLDRGPQVGGAAARNTPFVRLTVSDTGSGMSAATMEHIFEPFFTTKEKGRGTGLGLSMVFGIVHRCGGGVSVRSELGRGTTFDIDFPHTGKSSTRPLAPAPALAASGGTDTVLVVDDEVALLRITARILESAGYDVLRAASGAEALRICEEHPGPIHLSVCDVLMPGMTGVAFAQRLKLIHAETRVLYMSGYTDDVLVDHGVAQETVQLLGKPFSPDELKRRVREVLDAPAAVNVLR
jgi:two-component system cell cycle sensor histidine kinase/response regulator CckA